MNTAMIFIFCVLHCLSNLLVGVYVANPIAFDHPGGMHPQKQIDFVKTKVAQKVQPYYDAYLQLMNKTDEALTHPVHAVANFSIPGYYIHPAEHMKNSLTLASDSIDAYACALAYHISGDQTLYADESLRFLNAWADINKVYSDSDGPLVMSYAGTAMVMAGELLYNYNGWNPADKAKFFQWVSNVYLKAATEIRTRANNWGDWGRLGSMLSAHILDNSTELNETIHLIKSDIFSKIAQDGHMPEEVVREANGIWYTYFSLAPMTAACWMIYQTTQENLFTNFSQGNASIKHALDYLYYYNTHPDQWPWYKNPNKGSPSNWPGNLLEAMASIYNDTTYVDYVQPARPVMVGTHHYAWSFPTLMRVQLGDYTIE